jgi:glutamate-1-semialdehyde aminotransferase
MVNNIREAQPLYGISKADIIYETQAEGGITRLLACFEDITTVTVIGSIRSARDYYIDLAQGLNAIFVHCGASPQATSAIKNRGLNTIDGLSGTYANTFYRDSGRKAAGYATEHQLFTDVERLTAAEDKLNAVYDAKFDNSLKFSDEPLKGVKTEAAAKITVKHSGYKSTLFEYDSASSAYLVSQFGKAMNDADTDEQLTVSNVLVLKTSITNVPGDTSGRVAVKLTGSGDGTFYCQGKSLPVKWSKKDSASPFVYTQADGTPLVLLRGKTYINIVANDVTPVVE